MDCEDSMTTTPQQQSGRFRALHEKFVVEVRPVPAEARRNLYVWAGALAVIGLLCFIGILINVLQHDDISTIDAPIEHWIDSIRTPPLTTAMILLAIVFGPIGLPIIILVVIVAWTIAAKHAWRPLLLAAGTLTGVIIVQIITRLVGRHRPPLNLMLFGPDSTFSFPSGHVLGACDFLLILTYLVYSRRKSTRTAVFAFIVATILIFAAAFSRVYLGYHWATDALASMSLSLVILGGVIALDTHRTVRVKGES
jgi:membrane-associated phospholipid phosphatase